VDEIGSFFVNLLIKANNSHKHTHFERKKHQNRMNDDSEKRQVTKTYSATNNNHVTTLSNKKLVDFNECYFMGDEE